MVQQSSPVKAWADDKALVAFCKLLLCEHGLDRSREHIDELCRQGESLESIYLDLISPAARWFGRGWEDDTAVFSDVTVGLAVLQHLLLDLSPRWLDQAGYRPEDHSILLAPAPGCQHTLGLLMVSDFFRRGGWRVWCDSQAGLKDVLRALSSDWYDVAGFSVGADRDVEAVKAAIVKARSTSLNRDLRIMVGGPMTQRIEELGELVGADFTALDAPDALKKANRIATSSMATAGPA